MVVSPQQSSSEKSSRPVLLRPADSADKQTILEINRLAWIAAYSHVYSPQEIQGLFDNTLRQHGSWVMQRDQHLMTIVAEVEQQVVGFIGLGTLRHDRAGEVTTFYMHPDFQGIGIGTALWECGLSRLYAEGYPAAWVWVLERADARRYYEARGCIEKARGRYSVGSHSEVAIGYWIEIQPRKSIESSTKS